ncbi:serine protease [bacterium]|nr:MAG: serine protease [bacterium]
MMHRYVALALIFTMLPASAVAQQAPATAIETSSVLLHGAFASSSPWRSQGMRNVEYCGGVVVGREGSLLQIATARHCATYDPQGLSAKPAGEQTDAKPDYVMFRDGDKGLIERVVIDADDDLALLYVKAGHDHPPAVLAKLPVLGQPLWVYGTPGRWRWILAGGIAALAAKDTVGLDVMSRSSGDNPSRSTARDFAMDCPLCQPGYSGAAVWNAAGGVVGILSGALGGFSLVVPSMRLRAFMGGETGTKPPENSIIDNGAADWVEP